MNNEIITTSTLKRMVQEIEDLQKTNEQHRKINGELREEIERLNNIIKEAREYLKDNACYNDMGNFNDDLDYDKCGDLLEILDRK